MSDLTVKRTLVKSPPELWSELSEVERLAKHLGAFGEIKITKLEPEHAVAWEGEGASGTVSIEASGWGTKVTLTAQLEGEEAAAEEAADAGPADAEAAEEAAAEEAADAGPADAEAADEAAAEEAADAGPAAEAVAETTASKETVAAEPMGEAVVADTVAAGPIEPTRAKPRRRRGLLAWLFRTRSSAQVAVSPTMAHPPVVVESEPERSPVAVEPEPVAVEPVPVALEPEPVALEPEPVALEPEPEPGPVPEPEAEAEDDHRKEGLDPERAQAILDEVLDALGSAHHRPFSRG